MPLGRIPQASYYDSRNRPTAALYRARQPYLIRNALTGIGIFAFVAGIYTYTLKAIGQDDFSDVPIPDAPVQQAQAPLQQAQAPNVTPTKSAGKA